MLSFLHKYAKDHVYSQNGEEGIIYECLFRMDIAAQGHAVEIGGHDGRFCSNTAMLLDNGWSGLFVEADYHRYLECQRNWAHSVKVRSQCSRVDGKNINAFVDDNCDLLSLDTDGFDYAIFDGLNAKPKIVIVEIDSSIPPERDEFNSDGGAGYLPMLKLGLSKGYFLLCHTGNLIFLANEYRELFPEIERDGLSNSELYFKRDWLREAAA
jgi:hypothetical protein